MKARWLFPAVALCLSTFIAHGAQFLSTDFTGTRAGNAAVGEPFAINADGRFAAFNGNSTNYVANDTNGALDVVVHDCVLHRHIWDTAHGLHYPLLGAFRGSTPWAFTPDGRYLLFSSTATNFASDVTFTESSSSQLYVQDLLSNITTLVTRAHDGTNAADRSINRFPSENRTLSSDGRFVGFLATATNLVPLADRNGIGSDLFCRDLLNASTELITVAPDGLTTLDNVTFSFVMSTNGRFFAFSTSAMNVVGGGIFNTARTTQVYWRDRLAGTNALVTITWDGAFAFGGGTLRDMSSDGRYVCFQSGATNIVQDQNDSGSASDLFIRDMFVGETWLVSRSTNGTPTGADGGQFSANGRVLIFSANTASLVPGISDANGISADVFAHYVQNRSNAIVSVSWQGNTGADAYAADGFANISASGRYVLFTTSAGNLIPGSTTKIQRLYLRDLEAGFTMNALRSDYFPTPSFNYAHTAISDTERYIFFMTQDNFDPFVTDTNLKNIDLFRAPLYQPKFLTINPPPNTRMIAEGLPNTPYMLQASMNLTNWTDLYSITSDAQGRLLFYDPPVTYFPKRFYRLLWP